MALGSENIVWVSTHDSRAEGKLSVLACAEVILSVIAYWWIYYAFDTYLHLIVSICVAPLVLLRSEVADPKVLTSFAVYYGTWVQPAVRSKTAFAIFGSSMISGYISAHLVAEFLTSFEESLIFLISLIIGFNASAAVLYSCYLMKDFKNHTMIFIALIFGFFGVVSYFSIFLVCLFILSTCLAAVFFASRKFDYISSCKLRFSMFIEPLIWIGNVSGVLVRAIWLRFVWNFRFILSGIKSAPTNWRRCNFVDDLAYGPEFVPGIAYHYKALTFLGFFEWWLNQENFWAKVRWGVVIPIWFVPTFAYRISIKSTAWLYFPIIYIATVSPRMADTKAREKWAQAQPTRLMEWFRMLAAAVTLLTFVATIALPLIAQQQLTDLLQKAGMGEVPISVFSLILVLDWQAFTQIDVRPWQYFTLPSALITVVLFFWLDALGKDAMHGVEDSTLGWQSRIAYHLSRLRTVLVICWLALAFYYVMAEFHARCDLPDPFQWLQALLDLHFGECALSQTADR